MLNKNNRRYINKIAFVCHEATMFIHYSNVWKKLEPDSFDIVLIGPLLENKDNNRGFRQKVIEEIGSDINVFELPEILEKGLAYKHVVSNHCMGETPIESINNLYILKNILISYKNYAKYLYNNKIIDDPAKRKKYNTTQYPRPRVYTPKAVGDKQIRFMYGPDISDGWSLGAWNSMYDLVLCHGEADAEKIRTKYNKKTEIMGYPRYDSYFSDACSPEKARKEFGLSENTPVIYWMPTVDAFDDDVCSIPFYADLLSRQKKYTIIVRPHPITYRTHPHLITLLEEHGYLIDSDSMRDTSEIFKISSAVLCDHGGSPFGAFYLRKKLIFLKTPKHEKANVFKNSSNQELMTYFPMLDTNTIDNLESVIEDENLWEDIYSKSQPFYKKTYGNYFGRSADKAASILMRLDDIL
ncbi:CDP-glycerol glycerophosphotransferase family protein [Desulfoplanes formicivorans]|uniref:CDP-glycerol:poly(Glycerophosphate) glycerophosphotransferase n=1 Tax=Desulfoplanes formicivorans TaxID=1592317 RepID=A0A194AL11_9BACT|nr:CDP-glycerol glycerophosphotransferase family protein [Desulfoplanes formicivorans]GAU09379.1 hypothetical protein DPF_2105 [Desulfoplanes formicivorans]